MSCPSNVIHAYQNTKQNYTIRIIGIGSVCSCSYHVYLVAPQSPLLSPVHQNAYESPKRKHILTIFSIYTYIYMYICHSRTHNRQQFAFRISPPTIHPSHAPVGRIIAHVNNMRVRFSRNARCVRGHVNEFN